MPVKSSGTPGGLCWGMLVAASLVGAAGCGDSGLEKVPLTGTVMIRGQAVPDGEIRFVPIEGTKGPVSVGNIVNGQYEIEARGGVPVGKHRVEIRVIGQPIAPAVGDQESLTSSTASSIGPDVYDGSESPLTADVSSRGVREFDFEIP